MTRIVGDFPHMIREQEHAWIPLSDGTRLACRYWLPTDAETNPESPRHPADYGGHSAAIDRYGSERPGPAAALA